MIRANGARKGVNRGHRWILESGRDVERARFGARGVIAAVSLGLAALACGSIKPALPNPMIEPVVDQPGDHIVRYRDLAIEVVVDSTFAAANPGEPWLVLNVGLSGMTGEATEVDRKAVSVRTPAGRTVPLPSYKEFNQAFGELTSLSRRAALASQPLDFTRGGRRSCAIDFMPVPGSARVARTAVNVTKNDFCVGLLYFPIRGGVQPGPWKLLIEFEESEAVVPFVLEAE